MPNKNNSYIWYCPRKSCGAIIFKTNKHYINDKKKHICKRCNVVFYGMDLILANKRNIKKYIFNLEKKL